MRLGVVGCGLIAQLAHLPALTALRGRFAVVAVADPSPRVRAAVARLYGVADAYARHEELLELAGVDAVLVASPNGTHAQVTLDALAAGAHVLVEKPLCLSPADAARIVRAAAGRVVQVGYMKRFDAAYEALRERLPAPGALRLIASTTVDPGIGERYRPAGFIAPTDVRASDRDALARATAEQVAAAIGSDDPRHVKPFSDAFLGALVHDVNLALGLLDDLELEPGPVLDAAAAADGSLAFGACAVGESARWTAAWMLLPGAAAFREELRRVRGRRRADALLRRALRRRARAPATSRATRASSAPAPTATRASSSTSTTASRAARRAARRPLRERATWRC